MTLKNLKVLFVEELKQNYSQNESEVLFFMILDFVLGKDKLYYLLHLEEKISVETSEKIQFFLSKLKKNYPVQYLIHKTSFFGLPFFVDENVLIPRQETEELVAMVLKNTNSQEKLKILDIGTGSGCIAVSLAKYLPKSKVFALDISEKALEIAQKNARVNDVNIQFCKADILKMEALFEEFDIIVSNPPYVRECEKKEIHLNVLNFEPHLALFVSNENPLLFYQKITDLFKSQRKKESVLYFEINQYLGKEMMQMLENKQFSKVKLFQDLQQNDRIIKVEK